MFKVVAMIAAFFLVSSQAVLAGPQECVAKNIKDAAIVGSGPLSVMGFPVYDAVLYAPKGNYRDSGAYALSLTYKRDIAAKRIVDTSVKEMRRIGMEDNDTLDVWRQRMLALFPDVARGVTLTGIRLASGKTIFCRDSQFLGKISDPDFAKYFFGIWLDEKTSVPGLRRKLLGTT